MLKYKCIIFDCDGVLVDSEPIASRVLVEMANELGADINYDFALRNFKGTSIQECHDQIAALVTEEMPADFLPNFRTRSFESFKKDIQPVEGIVDLLNKLTNDLKIPFCVASSGPENKIKLNLELTGLLPFFHDRIFSCFAIEKWKPEPDVFLWAAETMGFEPEECLVIEDSVAGITAAKRGGFDVYGYTAHDYVGELKNHATLTFNHMSEVINLISKS